ncbi:hypothetical protein GCM10023261_11760 [Bartonella jaculi]|uniref:Uncharacterized protein n=1 Tax=Bartonella jaculi TaxID=686226 RepID=A0ABP9N9B7_9HYPH
MNAFIVTFNENIYLSKNENHKAKDANNTRKITSASCIGTAEHKRLMKYKNFTSIMHNIIVIKFKRLKIDRR